MEQSVKILADRVNRQGVAHCQAGEFTKGADCYREAARLDPGTYQYHLNLGNALNEIGSWQEARAALVEARRLAPAEADIHKSLARAALGLGQAKELALQYLKARDKKPDDPLLRRNASLVLLELRRVGEATALAESLTQAAPQDVDAKLLLADCLLATGQMAECENVLMEALRLQPRNVAAGFKLGTIRSVRGHYELAAANFETVLRLSPDHAEAMQALAFARLAMGQVTEAISLLRRVLHLQPKFAAARQTLAWALTARGSVEDSVIAYRAAMALAPHDRQLASNLVYSLSLIPSATRSEILEAHLEWGRWHGGGAAPTHNNKVHNNKRDPERRLKIGYVSPDLREHSIAYFVEPLLKERTRTQFEVFCYADGVQFDATSERLKSLADRWYAIGGASDEEVLKQMEIDGIDILVDLAGHTASNRLSLFARKPAPVQITWLGYPETTGVSAIDYKITDAFVSPSGAEHYATEKLLRLENGFHCYQPPADCPEVAPATCIAAGQVTFGSFADLPKMNPEIVRIWGQVLLAVPGARMLIKCRQFADENLRDKYFAMFRAAGVARERLIFMGRSPNTREHLASYASMDIALDTHPYSGTTTICEALWMGVPVVTMTGERPASRVGGSLLTQAGLAGFIAGGTEEFVSIASSLAKDKEKLARLRSGMRTQLSHSSLRDAAGFAQAMEAAYRAAWQRWCSGTQT